MRERVARWRFFLRVYGWFRRANDPVDSMLAASLTVSLMEAAYESN